MIAYISECVKVTFSLAFGQSFTLADLELPPVSMYIVAL